MKKIIILLTVLIAGTGIAKASDSDSWVHIGPQIWINDGIMGNMPLVIKYDRSNPDSIQRLMSTMEIFGPMAEAEFGFYITQTLNIEPGPQRTQAFKTFLLSTNQVYRQLDANKVRKLVLILADSAVSSWIDDPPPGLPIQAINPYCVSMFMVSHAQSIPSGLLTHAHLLFWARDCCKSLNPLYRNILDALFKGDVQTALWNIDRIPDEMVQESLSYANDLQPSKNQ